MSPVTSLCVALVLGIALGHASPWAAPLSLGLAAGAVLLCHASASRGRLLRASLAATAASLCSGLALGAGGARAPLAWKAADHVLVGRVERVVPRDDGRTGIALGLERAGLAAGPSPLMPAGGPAWVRVAGGRASAFRRGDVVLLRVGPPSARGPDPLGPGPTGRVSPSASLVAGPLVLRPRGRAAGLLEAARGRVRRGLEVALSGSALGLSEALVLGDRSGLVEEELSVFRRTGTAHLLAVSGLHVSIVTGLLLLLSTRLLLWTPLARRCRVAALGSLVATAGCWGYAALTGLAPPVFRAAVMASAALAAVALGRPRAALRSLALAAALLLALEPDLLWQPGFQLSFAAVLGLLARARRRAGARPEGLWPRLGGALAGGAAASAVASLATAPLVAHHFGTASPAGLVVNVAAVPAMAFAVLPATLLVAVASAVSPAAGAAISPLAEVPLLALLGGLRWVAELPGASVAVARPSLGEALLLTAGVVLAAARRRRGLWVGLALVAVAAGSFAARSTAPSLSGRLRVTFLAVGDGDSTLVELPGGVRMLVDTGPRPGTADRPPPAVEAVERSGRGRLDVLVLTHGHADHAGGLAVALARVGARELWQPLPGTGADVGPFEALARQRGTRVRLARDLCGSHRLGRARLEVLHPCEGRTEALEENDRSIVLRLVYGRVALLLPGDVEAEGEAALLRLGGEALRARVLKLPHHGSRTSSSEPLLDAVRPDLAVASAGRSRGRPLPHPEVAARLARRGVRLLSTAEHGSVRVSTDGEDLRVEAGRLGRVGGSRQGLEELWLRGLGM